MDEILMVIRSGTFLVQIKVGHLGELPRTAYRKLLRIAMAVPEENDGVVEQLGLCLENQVAAAKNAWAAASRAYQDGWKLVPKNSRLKKDREALKENRRLKADLKKAKGAYDNAVRLLTVFNEECN